MEEVIYFVEEDAVACHFDRQPPKLVRFGSSGSDEPVAKASKTLSSFSSKSASP
jgi:hypothetical protein